MRRKILVRIPLAFDLASYVEADLGTFSQIGVVRTYAAILIAVPFVTLDKPTYRWSRRKYFDAKS